MVAQTADRKQAQEEVTAWNAAYGIGTRVVVDHYEGVQITRTEAMLLFDRRPAIYLEGFNGYFDLSDVHPEREAAAPVKSILETDLPVDQTLAYMFPGQGSQAVGMGEGLFDTFPELTQRADQILGYSIRQLCLEDPDGVIAQTDYTQPALFVVNALSYLQRMKEKGVRPGYVLGHSLGEYSALFAAEVFDFETGLRLVQKRGALMAEAKGGGMAAVIGMDATRVAEVLEQHGLDAIDVANHNTPVQTVISGLEADVLSAQPVFMEAGARVFIPLKVSGAFHSRYMADAQQAFRAFMDALSFAVPRIPVIANVTALPHEEGTIRDVLAQQLISPVRWIDSIRYLERQRVATFEEVGPGTVLGGMIAAIRR
uniref:[acyl-carrier-protein] S-malonyltransferase n=1 Tax=uncultured bacterial symbiont of Discodermia dissoluta TaxID=323654 RepID=Q49HJ4_9BACT|nr:acyltransferase [uncultured bacterial symbiont of Discodermia dissoluta]